MNYKLIMLPQPILISNDEIKEGDLFYSFFDGIHRTLRYGKMVIPFPNDKKIIAGIEGLPKLDLSAIAEEIGLVDLEKLAKEYSGMRSAQSSSVDKSLHNARVAAFKEGYKAAQSLNEKKYSEEDLFNLLKVVHDKRLDSLSSKIVDNGKVIDFNFWNSYSKKQVYASELIKEFIQSLSKPKEYNVQYTQEGNTIKVTKIL